MELPRFARNDISDVGGDKPRPYAIEVARFILALWVEMPPDKSGNFARNDTFILSLRG